MSCTSLYSTGAQPWKVTEEKGIVMWCETCGGESIDWKMHWSHTHTHTHTAWHPYWRVKVASMQAILFCPLGFLLIQALPKNGVILGPWLWILSLNGKYSLVLDFGCFWKCDTRWMQIFVWWFAWNFCADYYIYFLTATAGSWWSQWVVMAACPCYIVINAMKVWHFCEWLSLIRLWQHSCDVVTSQSVCYCGDQYYVYSWTISIVTEKWCAS
jgi:hypothetical protein